MNETRNDMLRYETTYSKYATLDKDAIRLEKMEEDIRPSYYHDIDRIIYSEEDDAPTVEEFIETLK